MSSYIEQYNQQRDYLRCCGHQNKHYGPKYGLTEAIARLRSSDINVFILADIAPLRLVSSTALASRDHGGFTDIILSVQQIQQLASQTGFTPSAIARATLAHEAGHIASWIAGNAGHPHLFPDDDVENEAIAWGAGRELYLGLFGREVDNAFELLESYFLDQAKRRDRKAREQARQAVVTSTARLSNEEFNREMQTRIAAIRKGIQPQKRQEKLAVAPMEAFTQADREMLSALLEQRKRGDTDADGEDQIEYLLEKQARTTQKIAA